MTTETNRSIRLFNIYCLVAATALFAGCAAKCPEVANPASGQEAPVLGLSKTLSGAADMEQAVATVTEALKAEGFGIVSDMNVSEIMKKKLDKTMRPYRVLGACHAEIAYQALELDSSVGLLLPCKVIVYQNEEGAFVVSLGRPEAVFSLANNPELDSLTADAGARIQRVFEGL